MIDNHPERIKLESGLARMGLDVPTGAIDGLLTYMVLLKEWSGTYNLVAKRERDFLLARHVLDSLSIARWLQPGSLLDVGTGRRFARLAVGHYQAGDGSHVARQRR